jgi:hypothetical protein
VALSTKEESSHIYVAASTGLYVVETVKKKQIICSVISFVFTTHSVPPPAPLLNMKPMCKCLLRLRKVIKQFRMISFVGFQVLTAGAIKNSFWDIMPCGPLKVN